MTQTEGVDLSGVAFSSWVRSWRSAPPFSLLFARQLRFWMVGCVGSWLYMKRGLSNHEPLCHLHGSASGRTVLCFWDSPAVPHTPSPCTVPECPRPATTRPRPHVATTATPSGQGGVEVLTGLQGVLKAGAAVGRGGAPRRPA